MDPKVIDDMRDRISRTRWAPDFNNDDWSYGVNGAYLKSIADYWANDFDWYAQERAMNRFDHFKVELDDVPVHYIFKKGVGPSPIPIVLTHGGRGPFGIIANLSNRSPTLRRMAAPLMTPSTSFYRLYQGSASPPQFGRA